jgi:hypothetical protein
MPIQHAAGDPSMPSPQCNTIFCGTSKIGADKGEKNAANKEHIKNLHELHRFTSM